MNFLDVEAVVEEILEKISNKNTAEKREICSLRYQELGVADIEFLKMLLTQRTSEVIILTSEDGRWFI